MPLWIAFPLCRFIYILLSACGFNIYGRTWPSETTSSTGLLLAHWLSCGLWWRFPPLSGNTLIFVQNGAIASLANQPVSLGFAQRGLSWRSDSQKPNLGFLIFWGSGCSVWCENTVCSVLEVGFLSPTLPEVVSTKSKQRSFGVCHQVANMWGTDPKILQTSTRVLFAQGVQLVQVTICSRVA